VWLNLGYQILLYGAAWARVRRDREEHLAPRAVVHGVLMDILGLGVLIVGESGIGKSECALDLVVRGHRLVADDAVDLRARAESFLIGTCPELTRHHMEIRGLGLINVQDLFGVASTRRSKRVELVVHAGANRRSGSASDVFSRPSQLHRDTNTASMPSRRCNWQMATPGNSA